jgi:hypothetical protein
MGVLTQLSASLLLNAHNYVTMHNEGVYIPFPSFFLKLSNLILNSIYLFHLNINASIYFRRERMAQGPITFTSASHLNGFI